MTEEQALDMILGRRAHHTDYVGRTPVWRVRESDLQDGFGLYEFRDATPEEAEVLERVALLTGTRTAQGGGGATQGPGEWLGWRPDPREEPPL